ncbi:MAG: HEPN domain-containing protein [Lachnoclostridium sp.]|jgi:HEPN domain-containing protein|nr:HEPN domain-containing protein [Lachnoclostridium sp.]
MHPKPIEISCYLAEQSAEKLLKGFLVSKGEEPVKTHNLILLNDLCVAVDKRFETLNTEFGKLNPYGIQPRYPQEMEITENDAMQALKNLEIITIFFEENIF